MPKLLAEGYKVEQRSSADIWTQFYDAIKTRETLQFPAVGLEGTKDDARLILALGSPAVKGIVCAEDIGPVFQDQVLNLVGLDVAVKVKHCDRSAGVVYFDRKTAVEELAAATWADIEEKAPRLIELGRTIRETYEELQKNGQDGSTRQELAKRIAELRNEGAALGYSRLGVIRWVLPRAAYADVGGLTAMIPVAQLTHSRDAKDARLLVRPGEVHRLRITAADHDKNLLSASLKAELPDPWDGIESRYRKGGMYVATVLREYPRSFLVEFEPGVIGFLRKFQWSQLSAGSRVLVYVTDVDVEGRALSCRFVRLVEPGEAV